MPLAAVEPLAGLPRRGAARLWGHRRLTSRAAQPDAAADRLPIVAAPPVASADEVRLAFGLVDVRNQPLFKAAAAKKQLAAGVLASWRAWQWAPGGTPVGKLVVYTDGSGVLGTGWPRAVRMAG